MRGLLNIIQILGYIYIGIDRQKTMSLFPIICKIKYHIESTVCEGEGRGMGKPDEKREQIFFISPNIEKLTSSQIEVNLSSGVSLILSSTKSTTSWLVIKFQIPSHARIIQESLSLSRSNTRTSGWEEIIWSIKGRVLFCLYAWSPEIQQYLLNVMLSMLETKIFVLSKNKDENLWADSRKTQGRTCWIIKNQPKGPYAGRKNLSQGFNASRESVQFSSDLQCRLHRKR